MKKLFFTALVATVAVGGALSASALDIYPASGSDVYHCSAVSTPTCLDNLPAGKIYSNPGKTQEIDRADLEDYHFDGIN